MVGVAFICCTPVLSVGDRLFVYYMISFDKNKKLDLQAQSALYPGPGTNWASLEFKNLKIPRHEYVTSKFLRHHQLNVERVDFHMWAETF